MNVEERRAYQRRRYHENLTAERERGREKYLRRVNPDVYDASDYAEEFEFATLHLGLSARSIITRSRPGVGWFQANVCPRITLAHCGVCHKYFDPNITGTVTECSAECRQHYLHGRY